MELKFELNPVELNFVSLAAATKGINSLAAYMKAATIAASELVLVDRLEQLRPLAESLPDAKASAETLEAALQRVWAIGLPEISLESDTAFDDTDELISRLKDLLTDLQAFLRQHQEE
ncbi:hypothetical protein H6F67_19630 [Microcoleus sp. FACHB-1515]|uniref:hypothetical protein n=1 Tax=Cyanophyceae TaxID=3028117 RepID=UPI001688920C|nr:hypothetical protein [Microcoleus sp. FACHB-1515]MBD2092063.1 hypothetical protein [Microcoleus sp. FACHB-1515]